MKTIKSKCCDSTFTKFDTIRKTYFTIDTSISLTAKYFNKSNWDNIKYKKAKANITISKDTLLVNFWLFGPKSSNTCDLQEFPNAIIKSNTKYYIQLSNRQSASFWYHNYELGALTIPIKIRPGFTTNNTQIPASVTSNIQNIGTYIGYRTGKIRYWYNKYEDIKTVNNAFAIGAFLGVSNDKLDSLATTKAGTRGLLKNDTPRDVVSLSYGITALIDISDFRFGIMIGFDRAFGDNRRIWNYDNKLWFGIGIGYNLTFLRNPEK